MKLLIGIDEVGRGCIAGPLVVGAVALKRPLTNLKDSKVLTKKQRERLAEQIYLNASFSGLGWVSELEIDQIGLSKALTLAASRALEKLEEKYANYYLLDGNFNFLERRYSPVKLVIHGDALVPQISAASIIAKVARDEFMRNQAAAFPGYGFESHVGYATKHHLLMLDQLGISAIHRKSFEPVKSLSVKA